jgi:hypothetical protein
MSLPCPLCTICDALHYKIVFRLLILSSSYVVYSLWPATALKWPVFEHQFYMYWLANFRETREIVNTVPLIKDYSLRSNSLMNSTNGANLWGLNSVSTTVVSWGGVRLSPLGTSATIWSIVPALDDTWWVWSSRWNEDWQGKPKYSEKTYSSANLFTTNATRPDLGSNPGRRGGKPATNRLSCDTALALL